MPSNLQAIREEPQFGSMIWCDMDGRLSRPLSRRTSVATLNPYLGRRFSTGRSRRVSMSTIGDNGSVVDGIGDEIEEELDQVVDISQVYADLDPVGFL